MKLDNPLNLDLQNNRRYNVFIIIWAVASLFHMARSQIFTDGLDHSLLTIAIVLLLVRPSSTLRLLFFLAMQLCVTIRYMPNVSNHEIFYAFANLTILQTVLYNTVKRRTFQLNKADLFRTFAPVIRLELIIFYFYVVFHKFNTDFFNPEVSCATDFYNEQNSYSILPTSNTIFLANAYFTIIIEALIPLLLCFKRTRKSGIFIGLIFHSVIAYNPINRFFDISAAIFAAYVLFMNIDFSSTWYTYRQKLRLYISGIKGKSFSTMKMILACAILVCFTFYVFLSTKMVQDYFRYIFWTFFSFTFIYIYLKSINFRITDRENTIEKTFALAHPSFFLIPTLVFLNGLCPYVGLKTDYSFSMFSNLRTEGGMTNHFFVPVSAQIFDYQKDLVEVISSTDPHIQELADEKRLSVFFSFNTLVHYLNPKKVEYIRNGKRFTYERFNPEDQGDLSKDNPYFLKKILNFRSIRKYNPQPCSH